jgi:hypothetical protein
MSLGGTKEDSAVNSFSIQASCDGKRGRNVLELSHVGPASLLDQFGGGRK